MKTETIENTKQTASGAADPQTETVYEGVDPAEASFLDEIAADVAMDDGDDLAADDDNAGAGDDDAAAAGNADGDEGNTDDDAGESDDDGEEADDSAEDADADDDTDRDDAKDDDGDDDTDVAEIPKEYQAKVGQLLKKTRDKERAKVEARVAELEQAAARAQELEQQSQALTGELEQLRAAKAMPAPSADEPFADVTDETALAEVEQRYRAARKRLMTEPDNIQVDDGDGGKRYLSEEEVRRELATIDDRLQFDLPKRRQWLANHTQFDRVLSESLPEINDPKSEIARKVNQVITQLPAVKSLPGYRYVALANVVGNEFISKFGKEALKVLAELKAPVAKAPAKAAATKPAAVKPKAPKPPKAQAAPARPTAKATISDDEFYEGLADG
jgi:murein DD-endopeptidase MepM/ murein hydrolase activator NlpD